MTPLDNTATVFQELEQLCTVSRCECEKTCTLHVQLFDQNVQNYQKLLHSASGLAVDMAIQEGRLAWLIYLFGTFVGGRLTYTIQMSTMLWMKNYPAAFFSLYL